MLDVVGIFHQLVALFLFQCQIFYLPRLSLIFSFLFSLRSLSVSVSLSLSQVLAVIGIVFAVIVYRLAVSTLMYRIIGGVPGGASVADLTVSFTAAGIQLVFIVIMNFIYEKLATWLTGWGKQVEGKK